MTTNAQPHATNPALYVLSVLLTLSLVANLVQLYQAKQDRPYTQLGHNLIQSDISAQARQIAPGGDCETAGSLRKSANEVLTCSPYRKWAPARCDKNGLIAKDDSGYILTCDGTSWIATSETIHAAPLPEAGQQCWGSTQDRAVKGNGQDLICRNHVFMPVAEAKKIAENPPEKLCEYNGSSNLPDGSLVICDSNGNPINTSPAKK